MPRLVIGFASATALFGPALVVLLTGCGTLSGALKADLTGPAEMSTDTVADDRVAVPAPAPLTVVDDAPVVREPNAAEPTASAERAVPAPEPAAAASTILEDDATAAMAQRASTENSQDVDDEYDPWEPFNEKMFELNRQLDRWVLKPVAKVYNVIVPEPFQVLISNGFENINVVPRVVNNVLQGKWGRAGTELSRFLINSTAGIGGLFDPAKDYWGIQKAKEDFGQTLGVWGAGPGPYLILPLMEPLTVRDGIGKFVDSVMDPLSYVLPFFWDRLGMKAGDTINERALNLELFQGFEESVIDMYSAVRHAYLQRRERLIRE